MFLSRGTYWSKCSDFLNYTDCIHRSGESCCVLLGYVQVPTALCEVGAEPAPSSSSWAVCYKVGLQVVGTVLCDWFDGNLYSSGHQKYGVTIGHGSF